MATVPYTYLHSNCADTLIENQKLMSPGQRRMAQDHPHLMWVNPRSRNLSKSLRAEIYDRDNGTCAYCQTDLAENEFTIDHIEPVCKGGGDEPENLTVACRPCNSSKGGR